MEKTKNGNKITEGDTKLIECSNPVSFKKELEDYYNFLKENEEIEIEIKV